MEDARPVPLIPFAARLELLPAPAEGFTTAEPRGETISAMGFAVSEAERRDEKEHQEVHVDVLDGAFNAPIYVG